MAGQSWESNMADLAHRFAGARIHDSRGLLGELHGALCDAPRQVTATLGEPCDAAAFGTMLGQSRLENLAFELAGSAGLMLSRSPAGHAEATLVADGLFAEATCAAASVPLAIGGALSGGLAEWAEAALVPRLASRATH
jgi:hypothetical protein